MDEKLICPYCGRVQKLFDYDIIRDECGFCRCEVCDKRFWYEVIVTREYYSKKLKKE